MAQVQYGARAAMAFETGHVHKPSQAARDAQQGRPVGGGGRGCHGRVLHQVGVHGSGRQLCIAAGLLIGCNGCVAAPAGCRQLRIGLQNCAVVRAADGTLLGSCSPLHPVLIQNLQGPKVVKGAMQQCRGVSGTLCLQRPSAPYRGPAPAGAQQSRSRLLCRVWGFLNCYLLHPTWHSNLLGQTVRRSQSSSKCGLPQCSSVLHLTLVQHLQMLKMAICSVTW